MQTATMNHVMQPKLMNRLAKKAQAHETATVRLLHLSDFHLFRDPGSMIKGICSNDSLAAVLAHAWQHEPAPDAMILGGDLAQDESASTYRRLVTMLERWQVPFMVTPGNHANMSHLQDTLVPALESISAYSDCLDIGRWRVIALNLHEQGSIGGFLPDADLARLEQQLAGWRNSYRH